MWDKLNCYHSDAAISCLKVRIKLRRKEKYAPFSSMIFSTLASLQMPVYFDWKLRSRIPISSTLSKQFYGWRSKLCLQSNGSDLKVELSDHFLVVSDLLASPHCHHLPGCPHCRKHHLHRKVSAPNSWQNTLQHKDKWTNIKIPCLL